MEKEEKIEIESDAPKTVFNSRILILIPIILLIFGISTALLLAVLNYQPIIKNQTNFTITNQTLIPPANNSGINNTSNPIKNICGDRKCNGTENYTNCPKDCKKNSRGSSSGGGAPNPTCTSDCNEKNCGNDICGNSCGTCNSTQTCNSTGRCVLLVNCTLDTNCTDFTGICGTGKCNTTAKQCYSSFNSSTTVCRRNVSECDLVEMCTQTSVSCPNDVNKSNGASCSGNGICTNGKCTPCVIQCDNKVCGSNKCGGTCSPGCSSGFSCNSTGGCEPRIIRLTNNLSQYNITWYFDKEYEYGKFANGDYWVVGPVNITYIDPPSTNISGRIRNGAMLNPSAALASFEGYDTEYITWSGNYYKDELNVARPNGKSLSSSNSLLLNPGSSLISSISLDSPGSLNQILKTAAILTVLPTYADEGSFRPAYFGSDKTIRFNKADLDYSLLKKLPPVSGLNSLQIIERFFERPWLDHMPGWPAGAMKPIDNMPAYSRDMSVQVGEGALALHLNYSDAEKEKLLVRYVQLGIDFYEITKSGISGWWIGEGGHNSGRKWPIMFAGLMLNDAGMKSIGGRSGDYLGNPGYISFAEDDLTFYVAQADIDITNSPSFHPDTRDCTEHGYPAVPCPNWISYNTSNLGLPEWAITHSYSPKASNLWWQTEYRQCCNSVSWAGFVLAVQIMGVKESWNHDALFDYQDRYMEIETGWRQWGPGVGTMWDTYRNNYGCTWARDNTSDIYSQGHYNCSGQMLRCANALSTVGILATSCSQYPNQRACDYDPCNLACNGNCGISGSVANIAAEKPSKIGFFNWIKSLFS